MEKPDIPPSAHGQAHLERTARQALEALDMAASLADFSLGLASLEGPEPIVELCLKRVFAVLPFRAAGMLLVDEADSSFQLSLCEPRQARPDLEALAAESMEHGMFAFALREKRAVLLPGGGGQRRLLHVVTTAARTRGMFVGLLESGPELSEVALSLLSIVLCNTAQALESHALHRRIQEVNDQLRDKVACLASSEFELSVSRQSQDRLIQEKTGELQTALGRLEEEVRQRVRAEAELDALNQRLEARVEVRTKALFRKVAEMESANRQLKQLERLKSAFLSSVSHELRTPLTSIMGFAKLIARDFEKHFLPERGDARQARAERILRNLEIVEKESERLTRLINDVLDLSRIESGKMIWRDEPIRLHELVADAVMAVEGRMENRPDVTLGLDLAKDMPEVLADRDRILQVLINLLDNALKFTEQGFVMVRTTCRGEEVRVSVEDTGPGIAPSEAEKIFDKFHQHDRKDTLKDKPPGTGLGLAICRHIVERHGGRIWMEPATRGGSVFAFTLPMGSREA